MKTCPQCKQENPSTANHCMVCGALLIDKEIIPEEVLLKKELGEARETIKLLKKSLTVLQEKSENAVGDLEIQQLKGQIENCNGTIESLQGRIEVQKREISSMAKQLKDERKKKKGGKWGWLFVVLFLGTAFTAYMTWNDKQSQDRYYSDRINRLEGEMSSLRQEKENSFVELNNLQTRYDDVESKYSELKKQYPIIVDDIQIANVYSGGEIETDYGGSVYSGRTMYLKPRLSCRGFDDTNITFKVKWIKPDGTLSSGTSSPVGFSFSSDCSISKGSQTVFLPGWGDSNMGNWIYGNYRIEIWYGEIMLKSKSFTVYY